MVVLLWNGRRRFDAYSLLIACHFCEATTMPSLSTTHVRSSAGAEETGRTSLFLRVPLALTDVFCQLPAPPTLQAKLESLSQPAAQLSAQVKARSSPTDSDVTVWTHVRGDVKGGRSRAPFWDWACFPTLTLQGVQSNSAEDPPAVGGVWTLVLPSMEGADLSDDQGGGAPTQHLPTHSPLHSPTLAKGGSVATGEWHWLTHRGKHFLYTIWKRGTAG